MTSIKLIVTGASARAEVDGLLTSGMVGIPVTISYDSAWDGLKKTLVCRGGSVIRTILNVDGTATVPHECMIANATLQIGVEGRNDDGTLVIPTVWARCGLICSGANADADPSTDPTLPVWARIESKIGSLDNLNTQAKENLVAAINDALALGGGEVDPKDVQQIVGEYLASNPPTITESDPTVPAWAKQPEKPSYTAAEVGALPDTYTPPNQTAQQVGADPAGTASSAVSQHNVDTAAHNDLRLALQGLSDRINAALDSDDTTLDQMSEVVDYIKSNKSLIDAITTSKVSVSDIVNDLVTNVADKPLSAAQGVVLKGLIDALSNDKLDAAELTNAVNTALAQAKASGEFDGADGKSAYQYAVEGGYTGTEAEFAAKLAEEMPTTLPNPNALTFTGAVTGSYDGSEPLSVEIPGGGGEETELPIIQEYTIEADDVNSIEFTDLQNLREFELTVSWEWQTKAGSSTVKFTVYDSNGRDALELTNALNRGINSAIYIQGKPVSKSKSWMKFYGSYVCYNNKNSAVSTVQIISEVKYMKLYTVTSTVYFPVGTVVELKGK